MPTTCHNCRLPLSLRELAAIELTRVSLMWFATSGRPLAMLAAAKLSPATLSTDNTSSMRRDRVHARGLFPEGVPMFKLIWRLRAAIEYRRMACISFPAAWDLAGGLEDFRRDCYSPANAVREDISEWG